MKHKIAVKLALYFSAVVLLFAVIIGVVFMSMFKSYTVELYKADLQKRAEAVAATLSLDGTNTEGGKGKGRQGGYGFYLKALNTMAATDAWIVDENLELITAGGNGANYAYSDLPQDAEQVVSEVFKGKTTFSEGFSDLLDAPTLTVGTPLYRDGKIIGALLLHTPVEGIDEATAAGLNMLLISGALALALAAALAALLSFSFTRPLKKMRASALRLAGGDYSAKTGVAQRDEIGELAGAIDVLSVRLEEASRESGRLQRLRQDFVANISHELRTPVTVIRGSLEALCDGVVSEPGKVEEYHRQMLGESILLQRLVDDLLDLSRLQNADFKIEKTQVPLNDALDDAVRTAGHIAEGKGVRIVGEKKEPLTVSGDYGRLRQMFLVVLDNAVKFTPPGGEVRVALEGRTVTVRDSGPGIAPEDAPYIFDRFYKAQSAGNAGGTGLGLAIAKQIAERHGVKLSAENAPEGGAVFRFEF
ncbi:MAG TPA: ATP-binding protein [Clostridiales bacterium]|nr:ATP-binding protein [Clostridiales bacterium]HQK72862.1 ATP-binding protein [Clostridiales bacterium]